MITLALYAFASGGLINFLIYLLVLAVVVYCVVLVLNMFPLPAPVKTIAMIIVGLIALIVLLQAIGIVI